MPQGHNSWRIACRAGFALAACLGAAELPGAEPAGLLEPFEISAAFAPANPIDEFVAADLTQRGITPAGLCSDAVFVRRAFLDLIGVLPTANEAAAFLRDTRSDKRAVLVESLLAREEFADYWALKWCDLLRVKSEFPVNLWPNAVQAYHRWVYDAIRTHLPYNRFARALLTSSGSNFREPAVNFLRAVQGREPSALAAAVALTFMGTRLEAWPEERRRGLETLFSRVVYKPTAEWKEEIVCLDPAPLAEPLRAVLPDGTPLTVPPERDPRLAFADWLTAPGNPWFAPSAVNRVWSWLFGRGLVHPADDIRADNPAVNPALLAWLAGELERADYDLRQVFRLVVGSRTYQQASVRHDGRTAEAEAVFAVYPVRRLDAEVLIDALDAVFGGAGEEYSSPIPEPFTYVPRSHRTQSLADGSITSSFLEMFGRPARDTGLESERNLQPTPAQRLHLLNSSHIQRKIEGSPWLNGLLKNAKGDRAACIDALYLGILSRPPTKAERSAASAYLVGPGVSLQTGAQDLGWALLNSKEFLYRH